MIRLATDAEHASIASCIQLAFGSMAEVDLVSRLRKSSDLLLELVSEQAGHVNGSVVVSALRLEPNPGLTCGAIAPLSVLPDHQRQGFGAQLMLATIEQCKALQLDALFLLGDPAYYSRFGFRRSALASDYPADYFQELELSPGCLQGVSSRAIYTKAFSSL